MKILIDECLPDELNESVGAMGHECRVPQPYGFQGVDFDSLLARLSVFDPSRLFFPRSFVVAGLQPGSFSRHSSLATRHFHTRHFLGSSASHRLQ